MFRNNADEGYDYRVRTLDFANSDTPFSSEDLPPRWLTTTTCECAATNDTTASLGSPSCRWEVGISVWWWREVPVPGRRP